MGLNENKPCSRIMKKYSIACVMNLQFSKSCKIGSCIFGEGIGKLGSVLEVFNYDENIVVDIKKTSHRLG